MKRTLLILLLSIFLVTQTASLTSAQNPNTDTTQEGQSADHAKNTDSDKDTDKTAQNTQESDQTATGGTSDKKTPPGKQKACEKKQAVIKRRLDNLTKMATRMLETFNRIAGKVAGTGTNEATASGSQEASSSSNLSDAAQAKKKAVEDALAKAKQDAEGFTCTNSNPKQALKDFRVNMQSVKRALKEYRTEIKNMIKAKKAETKEQGSTTSGENQGGEDEEDD